MTLLKNNTHSSKFNKKYYLFIFQALFVATLIIIWISSESIRQNKSLWILFLYSFPSEFLIALVPHEPVLIYFGEFYHPVIVALVAVSSTVLTEILNYSLFNYISEIKSIEKIKKNKLTAKIVHLFNKAPFLALVIAGLTPVPFYPFRFLVVFSGYPVAKYALAIFTSRTPRFFILAALGHTLHIPIPIIIGICMLFILLAYISFFRYHLKDKKGIKQ